MDFRQYVRDHLPPLTLQREPEILDELAQHLGDLYNEARSAGCDHDAALARAVAALPPAKSNPRAARCRASSPIGGAPRTMARRRPLQESAPCSPTSAVTFDTPSVP